MLGAVDEGTAKSMGPDAEGIFISGSYFTTIDSPKNKEFLAAMQKKFGAGLKTPNDLSVPEYEGVYAYKLAVEKAGSTDADKVIAALSEVAFEGPRGYKKQLGPDFETAWNTAGRPNDSSADGRAYNAAIDGLFGKCQ